MVAPTNFLDLRIHSWHMAQRAFESRRKAGAKLGAGQGAGRWTGPASAVEHARGPLLLRRLLVPVLGLAHQRLRRHVQQPRQAALGLQRQLVLRAPLHKNNSEQKTQKNKNKKEITALH